MRSANLYNKFINIYNGHKDTFAEIEGRETKFTEWHFQTDRSGFKRKRGRNLKNESFKGVYCKLQLFKAQRTRVWQTRVQLLCSAANRSAEMQRSKQASGSYNKVQKTSA